MRRKRNPERNEQLIHGRKNFGYLKKKKKHEATAFDHETVRAYIYLPNCSIT